MIHSLVKSQAGVTLLELMIVVVIVGILAMIGYPSYAGYTIRAQRTDGRSAILQYASEQEKFIMNNNTYATAMNQLRGEGGATFITETGNYEVSLSNVTSSTYTITATYLGTDDEANKCKTFTINQNSVRTSAPNTDCWER